MRCHLLALMMLILLVTAAGAGCSAELVPSAAPDEPTPAHSSRDDEADPTAPPTPTPQREPVVPPATRTPAPSEPEVPPGAQAVVSRAREELARRLDLPRDAIRLVSVEAVDWPDAALGCPQPGMAHEQVITPGFLLLLDAEGRPYRYHTDQERVAVLCGPEQWPFDPVPLMPVAPHGIRPHRP
jgi:hypothetical protein